MIFSAFDLVSTLGQQQILILFNKTITVNESDVQWSGFSMLQCVFTTAGNESLSMTYVIFTEVRIGLDLIIVPA